MTRPFAIYPDSFDGDMLGFWRFGETGGRLTDLVAGKVLVNHGTVAEQDGYRTIGDDWLDTVYLDQGVEGQVTLEAWCRDWNTTAFYGTVFEYKHDADDYLSFSAMRKDTDHAASTFAVRMRVGGALVGAITVSGESVWEILASPQPWHIAVVLNQPAGWLRLYVNGVQLGQDASILALNALDYTLVLGHTKDGAGWTYLVIDEVRLSLAARYTANFPITRFGEGRRALVRGPGDGSWLGGMVA